LTLRPEAAPRHVFARVEHAGASGPGRSRTCDQLLRRDHRVLDSVPLAVSFAEVRREPVEDLDEEPLELEPLEGDEGL